MLCLEAFSIQVKKEKKDGYKSSEKVAKISATYLSMQMSSWVRCEIMDDSSPQPKYSLRMPSIIYSPLQ